MHLLITGATGFIGKHVLLDALADHRITKVTVVSRRPPSLDGKDMAQIKMAIINKLTIITRNDLGRWEYEEDKELVNALRDCKACIWMLMQCMLARALLFSDVILRCIGGKADDFATPSEFERISLTFTVNAANFFSKLAQEEQLTEGQIGLPDRRFRFCYCSAKWANRDGKANESLFSWEAHTRNMKGRVERELLSIASQSNGKMDVFVFRPGGAVAGATVKSLGGFATTVATAGLRMMPSVVIHVERIARVLVDASVGIRVEWQRQRPDGEKNTWESEEMVDWSLGLGV
ncbi:hypothetical protein F5I97DRAFT_1834719 [Phlebopus sp. FC_14]|nr:hypothetical protein F5I97DRAFT_1834719 [Phlebopus sp. FC_14]